MLIDTHTHLNMHAFEGEEDELIKKCLDEDIWLVNVGTKLSTSQKAIELAERYDEGVYATIAIHPIHLHDDIEEYDELDGKPYTFTTKKQSFDYDTFKALAQSSSKVVGIGETGLDIYRLEGKTREEVLADQEPVFRKSIKLAQELDLAVVVHGRGEANDPYGVYDDIIRILKEENAQRGVVHCFGGNVEQALQLAEMGFCIGVTGIVTFKNAQMLHDIVRAVPLESILIETDAPYLAPEPFRGKRNEPSYVKYVAEKIAELKGVSVDKIAQETTINARRMYII
jgi:TatD DNase family protein